MEASSIKKIVCSGAFFLAKDTKRFLLLYRTQGKTAGTWGLVGGKKEPTDQTPMDTLHREIKEEIGKSPAFKKIIPLELFTSNDQHFQYNTYVILVEKEFIPILNKEHSGFAWVNYDGWPKPLHQGVKNSLSTKTIKNKLEMLISLLD